MFDIGWTEMLVLGIVTLLAVGPRELPGLLRTIGRYVGQMRDMASDFRSQMDDVAEEIDARSQLKKLTETTLGDVSEIPDLFDPAKFNKDYASGDKAPEIAAEDSDKQEDKNSG